MLAVPAYGHFTVEHGRGHHRWVATPSDHASARMGESIYRFAWRELPGGVRRASRRYQSLRDFPDLPRLPSGYFGMFTLAYFPALWFNLETAVGRARVGHHGVRWQGQAQACPARRLGRTTRAHRPLD